MTTRLLTIALLVLISATAWASPPASKKIPVTDTFHGVSVTEDYRWLEDWDDEAVRQWSEAQNVHARANLDNLPNVDAIRARVTEILAAKIVSYDSLTYRSHQLFAMKRQPPKQQRFLVVMPSVDNSGDERVLVDPNELDSSGGISIDWYIPSPDGQLVAVSLSKGGSESGDVHIYATATGKEVHEIIPVVNGGTAGGDLAWMPDGSGFFYTRYPRGNERPAKDMPFFQQLFYHQLGTSTSSDRYELGKDLPRIAEIQLAMDNRTGRLLVTVQEGDGGQYAHYLRSADGKWKQFSVFGDKTLQAAFGPNDDLFVISRKGAPRGKILRMSIDDLDVAKAKTIIPEGNDTIVEDFWEPPTVLPTQTRLYVQYQLGGPSEIRVFDHTGERLANPQQLAVSTIASVTPMAGDEILYSNWSFIEPPAWYRFDPKKNKTTKTALATASPVDLSDVEVIREFATSKDGTRIPVNILKPKSAKLDGSNACIATGYGGFGVSNSPRFRSTLAVLLEQGVIYAVANIRGGGEFGEEWHHQGNLTNKQNVFDDFYAGLEHMIDRGYTSSNRLGITGGSNGGLLMGATLVQHPGIANAVVTHVGIYDMLRVELSSNGAFNIPEFGTVKDAAQFQAMYAYSPYHQISDGTTYPATVFLTGANDPRVDPMQSRKMTARLQAASPSAGRVLLRTSSNSGHGGDTSLNERIEQTVDVYAFFFDQLGIAYQAQKPGS